MKKIPSAQQAEYTKKTSDATNTNPDLLALTGRQSTSEQTWEVSDMASNTEIKESDLKWKNLNGKVKRP